MRNKLRFEVKWLPRRAPYFAIGFDSGEFRLYLWVVDIEAWWGY